MPQQAVEGWAIRQRPTRKRVSSDRCAVTMKLAGQRLVPDPGGVRRLVRSEARCSGDLVAQPANLIDANRPTGLMRNTPDRAAAWTGAHPRLILLLSA